MSVYQKCIPQAYYASIFEIPYQKLKEQGINSLFFDLDNTIIAYDEVELNHKQIEFIKDLQKDFKVLILSNTNFKRVSLALNKVDLPFIWYAKKPLKFGFKKALKILDAKKEETVIIGDQLMTDVFGANRVGIGSILVASVKRKSDRAITKFNRKIEAVILKKIQKKAPDLYNERLKLYVDSH
ncbi:MAG: YqeG family HAD IIIA-type phosphatase [Firmicutes bacterium]|nr:YqeG family HAD IIIA-type phosphatase [Bacillota bacterium]